jgi:hypothetical protein
VVVFVCPSSTHSSLEHWWVLLVIVKDFSLTLIAASQGPVFIEQSHRPCAAALQEKRITANNSTENKRRCIDPEITKILVHVDQAGSD